MCYNYFACWLGDVGEVLILCLRSTTPGGVRAGVRAGRTLTLKVLAINFHQEVDPKNSVVKSFSIKKSFWSEHLTPEKLGGGFTATYRMSKKKFFGSQKVFCLKNFFRPKSFWMKKKFFRPPKSFFHPKKVF